MKTKTIGKVISLLLCAAVLIPFPTAKAAGTVPAITGETSRVTKEIRLSDGTNTGVVHTEIKLSGYYGNNRAVNIAEGDLSNTNLTLRVINSGKYMVSAKTMKAASEQYNSEHLGETVLASVNGDLYMTSIHSGSSVTKKTLCVPRGILMVDGEIWASAQIDQENLGATNAEQGTPAGLRPAFGITDLNQPVIGTPVISVNLSIGGKSISADGINRLPAMDSIIVYNHRVNSSNYALNDAYEVVVKMDEGSAFTAGGIISGTITQIYPAGSATRPSLADENIVVLTARGSRVSDLSSYCSVGKRVTVSTSVYDKDGRTELWQSVRDAIGGHFPTIIDGEENIINDNTYYPTTLIGYKDDGTVALVTVTSTLDKSRAALKMSQAGRLCRELGYNSVFYLDGGGSTTFVTLEDGTYTVRNKCSDGNARSVIGGVGFVWSDGKVCMRQGELSYIDSPIDLSDVSPEYVSGEMMSDLMCDPNNVSLAYNDTENALAMIVNTSTNDPYATLDYTPFKNVNAQDYKYVVMKVKTNITENKTATVHYACGADTGAGADRYTSTTIRAVTGWQYLTFPVDGMNGWSGSLNNMRLDILNSGNMNPGDTVYIDSVILCKNETEAINVKSGWKPDTACTDYAERVENNMVTPYFNMGDTDADGEITLVDLFGLKLYTKGKSTPDAASSYASDIDGDGEITMVDSFELKYRINKGYWRIESGRKTVISEMSPEYMEGKLLERIVRDPNGVKLSYNDSEDAFAMTVSTSTNDPFATLDLTKLERVDAEDYRYVVLKVKTNVKANNSFALYYACGGDTGAAEARSIRETLYATNDWQYIVFDMQGKTGWSGSINNIRLDIFNSGYMQSGDAVYISSIALCKNDAELSSIKNGIIP